MNNYDNMFQTICRLCLTQNNREKMVSLIDNSTDDGLNCFGKSVMKVTKVSLRKEDKLPTMMCLKCAYLLKQTIYFKLKCESTDKQLKRLVNMNENSDLSEQNIKQLLCEYVMFNQYFPSNSKSEPSKSKKKSITSVNKGTFSHKIDTKQSYKNVETNVDSPNKTYEFDDFMDNDDNTNNFSDKQDAYSDEINNILDTIQEIINSDYIFPSRVKKKIKNEQQFQSVCGKDESSFKSNSRLSRKQSCLTISKTERNLLCKICNKVLANSLTYDHHMQRHNKCRYICDQCGKGFPVLTEMHMHQITQHGIGPYLQCDHCPYKAPRKLDLIEHLRLHTGERPFTCEKCGLTFRRKQIWRNHLICHMEKKVQCTYCPRRFYRHSSMLAHCNNVHERLYMYMCSVCSVTYTKTETVKRHMLVKHGIPREKQGRILRIANSNRDFTSKVIEQ